MAAASPRFTGLKITSEDLQKLAEAQLKKLEGPSLFTRIGGDPIVVMPAGVVNLKSFGRRGYAMVLAERRDRPIVRPASTLREVLQRQKDLPFAPLVIGRGNGDIRPLFVGNWFLEPIASPEQLDSVVPGFAQERLRLMWEQGIDVKAIVVYHELTDSDEHPSSVTSIARRISRFASAELPSLATRAGVIAKREAPGVLRCLLAVSGAICIGFAMLLLTTVSIVATVVDPCLVVVTSDDYFIEVAKWFH